MQDAVITYCPNPYVYAEILINRSCSGRARISALLGLKSMLDEYLSEHDDDGNFFGKTRVFRENGSVSKIMMSKKIKKFWKEIDETPSQLKTKTKTKK